MDAITGITISAKTLWAGIGVLALTIWGGIKWFFSRKLEQMDTLSKNVKELDANLKSHIESEDGLLRAMDEKFDRMERKYDTLTGRIDTILNNMAFGGD